jgi:hypothetical protein
MKEIQLSQGKIALVDDEDYDTLSEYKWYANRVAGKHWYATRRGKKGEGDRVRMHNQILDTLGVDHIDGDGLNNQRSNLRPATQQQNSRNRRPIGGKSQYKGVTWNRHIEKWTAKIWIDYKCIYLGSYKTEREAAVAYDNAAIKHFGEFAKLNLQATNEEGAE